MRGVIGVRDEVVGRKRAKLNILEKVGGFLTRLGSRRKKEKTHVSASVASTPRCTVSALEYCPTHMGVCHEVTLSSSIPA